MTTPTATASAYRALADTFLAAQDEMREATAQVIAIAQVIAAWKTATETQRADMVTECEPDCGAVFVRIPCPHEPNECHCPKCGNVFDFAPVAAAHVAPTENVSATGLEAEVVL